jgi:hypothetical protein
MNEAYKIIDAESFVCLLEVEDESIFRYMVCQFDDQVYDVKI